MHPPSRQLFQPGVSFSNYWDQEINSQHLQQKKEINKWTTQSINDQSNPPNVSVDFRPSCFQMVAQVVLVKNIGVAAGKFLGVRRIFAQIFAKLPEKNSFHYGCIFLNQSTSSTIFAQISPNLPEKN